MLKSLFVNSTILISFLYLGNQILKKEKVNLNSKLQEKILLGVFIRYYWLCFNVLQHTVI